MWCIIQGISWVIVPWSGTDPYDKPNCFTWSKKENDWIIPGDQYNEYFQNGEDLLKIINPIRRPSRRIEEHRGHATRFQYLSIITNFLEKERRKSLPNSTRITAVSTRSVMECGMYSLYQTSAIKRKIGTHSTSV